MKKFLAGLLAGLFIAATVSVYAETATSISVILDRVSVIINGQPLNKTVISYANETYVPLRAISDALELDISWDGATNTAYINFQEQLQEITPAEMDYINEVFSLFDEIQIVLDDINNIVFNTEKPYNAEKYMRQVISLFSKATNLLAPDSLVDYKAAVDNYCVLNSDIFYSLLDYIEENPGAEALFPEVFESKYRQDAMYRMSINMEEAFFGFLMQRAIR